MEFLISEASEEEEIGQINHFLLGVCFVNDLGQSIVDENWTHGINYDYGE